MVTVDQIQNWIASGNEKEFYFTYDWKQAAAEARRLQHDECQRCKARGWYSPCEAVHHRIYLKVRPDLALEQSNLECLCRECHEAEHGRIGAKEQEHGYINQERW